MFWKPRRTFERIREQIKLENSRKLCRGFHQAIKARRTCFISFTILLLSVLTKRKTIYKEHMYTLLFLRNVSSHNLDTTILLTSLSCFIVLWKHTCLPIKTHVLLNDNLVRRIHSDICKESALEHKERWYEYTPIGMIEKWWCKIVYETNSGESTKI